MKKSVTAKTKKSPDLLGRTAMKKTAFRQDLIRVFRLAKHPLTAAQIAERLPEYDRATIFRNLKTMASKDLVGAADFGTGSTFYCLNDQDHHHHHIFCVRCETARGIEECVVAPLVKKAQEMGYSVLNHRLELVGICPNCRRL